MSQKVFVDMTVKVVVDIEDDADVLDELYNMECQLTTDSEKLKVHYVSNPDYIITQIKK